MTPNPQMQAARIDLETHNPKIYHIPAWQTMNDKQKLNLITSLIKQYGRHPAVVKMTMGILKRAGVQPREYEKQAAVLLKWVQDNIYYINEPGERLQAPEYTLRHGYGDCDDMIILLLSMYDAIRLPNKLVISGKTRDGRLIRFHHGEKHLPDAEWSHIYGMVGNKPYTPTAWYYVEPTLKKPLGWDVVSAQGGGLPELGFGSASTVIGSSAGQAALSGERKKFRHYVKDVFVAVVIGAATAVSTQIVLDYIRETKWYRTRIRRKKRNGGLH